MMNSISHGSNGSITPLFPKLSTNTHKEKVYRNAPLCSRSSHAEAERHLIDHIAAGLLLKAMGRGAVIVHSVNSLDRCPSKTFTPAN